jgi:chromosome segregation ATPase
MPYLRYSQFQANVDGTPKQFTNKTSFSSHKSRKKNWEVIFSNINVNGKGVLFLTIVINETEPVGLRVVSISTQNVNQIRQNPQPSESVSILTAERDIVVSDIDKENDKRNENMARLVEEKNSLSRQLLDAIPVPSDLPNERSDLQDELDKLKIQICQMALDQNLAKDEHSKTTKDLKLVEAAYENSKKTQAGNEAQISDLTSQIHLLTENSSLYDELNLEKSALEVNLRQLQHELNSLAQNQENMAKINKELSLEKTAIESKTVWLEGKCTDFMEKLNNQKSLLESKLTIISDELAEKKRYAESLRQEMKAMESNHEQVLVETTKNLTELMRVTVEEECSKLRFELQKNFDYKLQLKLANIHDLEKHIQALNSKHSTDMAHQISLRDAEKETFNVLQI